MRCRFKHKIFQNEENGYTIAIFTTQDTSVPLSARDKYLASRNIIGFSAIGFGLPLTDEIELEMEGRWGERRAWNSVSGGKFHGGCTTDKEGILGYLSCGSLKEVGTQNGRTDCQSFWSGYLGGNGKVSTGIIKDSGDISEKTGSYCGFFWKKQSIPGIDDFFITVSCYA